jgi:hypothetical protein
MDELWPLLQSAFPKGVTDVDFVKFCDFLHASMMEVWEPTTTNFLREHLEGLKNGNLVHEEIADELVYLLCEIMGVAYLDSSGRLHPAKGAKGRLLKDLEILNETVAAGTLVLPCTYSALVECGDPRFLKPWQRAGLLKPYCMILWLKSGCKHFTFVRMDLKKRRSPAGCCR